MGLTTRGNIPTALGNFPIQIGGKTKNDLITLTGTDWNEITISDFLEKDGSKAIERALEIVLVSTSAFKYSHTNETNEYPIGADEPFTIHVGSQENFYLKGSDSQNINVLLSVLIVEE